MLRDLRYGLRVLLKERTFTLVVVVTLGLAMGASSTIYTMVHFSLLRDMPFTDTDTLAFVWATNPELGSERSPWSYPDFEDLGRQVHAFRDVAAMKEATFNLTGVEEPVRIRGFRASSNFFPLMGLKPILGRGFLPEEDRPDGPQVVVFSHGSWERRFGGDPNILGRQIVLNDQPHTVVGVMTPELEVGFFMDGEVWTPLQLDADGVPRDARDLIVAARLREGASIEQAQAELTALTARLEEQYPRTNSGWSGFVVSYDEDIMGKNARLFFLLLIMTVVFVMLIACSNVANLLLARASARAKELALRVALGAGRMRIIRQLLAESVLVSVMGGALGLLFSHWAFALLLAITRSQEPFFRDLEIDGSVLAFSLVTVFLTPLVFGLLPAVRASRMDVNEELKESGGRFASGWTRQRLGRALVTSEVSLALVLLVVSGLLIRSQLGLTRIDLGFDPDHVLTFRVDLSPSKYDEIHEARAFFNGALGGIRNLPGIREAGFVSNRPIVGGEPRRSFTISGRPLPEPGETPWAAAITVSPSFFSVLKIPLLQGRMLSERDTENSPRVALISQSAARRYWRDENPIGARILLGDAPVEVVGVVADVRNPDADRPPEPHLYLPYAQNPIRTMALVARTDTDALSAAGPTRQAIWRVDPNQPVYDVRTMDQIVYDDLASSYALISLMTYFTLIALGLAVAGVYSVISYAASRRSREVGIRMALGARTSDVLAMMLRQGLAPVALGTVIGLAGALGLSKLLSNLIYGISTTDPATYLGVTLILGAAAFSAALTPAMRAARRDPSHTLRHD